MGRWSGVRFVGTFWTEITVHYDRLHAVVPSYTASTHRFLHRTRSEQACMPRSQADQTGKSIRIRGRSEGSDVCRVCPTMQEHANVAGKPPQRQHGEQSPGDATAALRTEASNTEPSCVRLTQSTLSPTGMSHKPSFEMH